MSHKKCSTWEHQQVASKKGKNVERAGFSVGIVEHCVRECRGMESIGLLHLTLSSLAVKWHHRQLQGPLYDIGFLNKSSITSDQLKLQKESCLIYWTWFTSLRCTGVMRRYEWKLWVIIIMISVVGGRLFSHDNHIILLLLMNYLNHHDQCCGWPIIFIW